MNTPKNPEEWGVSIPQAEFSQRKPGRIRCLRRAVYGQRGVPVAKPQISQDNLSVAQKLEKASRQG